jgi:hypothetical protein
MLKIEEGEEGTILYFTGIWWKPGIPNRPDMDKLDKLSISFSGLKMSGASNYCESAKNIAKDLPTMAKGGFPPLQ